MNSYRLRGAGLALRGSVAAAVMLSAALAGPSLAEASATDALAACDLRTERYPDDPRESHCYLRAAQSGRIPLEQVQTHLEQLLERRRGHVQILLALASVRSARGDGVAATNFEQAGAEYARLGNAPGEVFARTAQASFLMRKGRPSLSVEPLEFAEAAANRSGDPLLIARVRTEQAWLAYSRRDFGRSLELLETVRTLVLSDGDADLASAWLSTRGATLWAIGRWDEARASYREQAARLEAAGNRYQEADARVNLVLLANPADRNELALEAARIARAGGNLSAESAAYFYLAESLGGEEGRRYAQRSLDLALAAGRASAVSRARRAVAFFSLENDQGEAFRLIDQAIQDGRDAEDVNEELRGRFVKASMRWQAGPRPLAIADSLALLDAIEATRKDQPEEEIQAQRFSQWRWAYHRLASHLLAGHLGDEPVSASDRALAFATLERMRGRLLLDRLDAAGASIRTAAGLVRNESSTTVTLNQVQQALAEDEALVTLQAASLTRDGKPFGTWVWTVTRYAVSVVPLHPTVNLYEAVNLFVGLFERRDGAEAAAAARLYSELLAPGLGTLPAGITKLIVIPDEMLYRVPFDALRESRDAAPLATRYQITLVPSAALWLHWRISPPIPHSRSALVMADPALPEGAVVEGGPARRNVEGLKPLPGARREGRIVMRALGRGSRMYTGDAATETAFTSEPLSRYGVLHVAAHAVIDERHPERTGIVLAHERSSTDGGVLRVREIVTLPLSGQLVMLTACRSADGLTVPGEGALGLAHAFFRAGASAVVASLWPIRDDDALAAVELIARGLGAGMTVGAAVTSARRELIARGAPAEAWAGLVVMGDGELVPLPGGYSWAPTWWMVGSLVCAAFAAANLIVRRAGRRRERRSRQTVACQ